MQPIQNCVRRASSSRYATTVRVAFGAAALLGSLSAPPLWADTITLEPEADNWLSSCPGGWGQKNGAGPSGVYRELRLRGWDYGPRVFRTVLRFDLDALTGTTIESATLRVYWHTGHWVPPSTPQIVNLYGMTNAWVEGNSNWRYADDPEDPENPTDGEWNSIDVWNETSPYYSGPGGAPGGGGAYDEMVPIASDTLDWTFPDGQESDWQFFPGEWLEFDVTEQVQAWIDGEENHGFLMRLNNELQGGPGMTDEGSTVYQFRSRECQQQAEPCDPAEKPHLEITYAGAEPIPAVSTWGMVVMSLLTLITGTLVFIRVQPGNSEVRV